MADLSAGLPDDNGLLSAIVTSGDKDVRFGDGLDSRKSSTLPGDGELLPAEGITPCCCRIIPVLPERVLWYQDFG